MNFEALIEKYTDLAAYRSFMFSADGRWLFYLARENDGFYLRRMDAFAPGADLQHGERLCDEDFSRGTFMPLKFDEARNWLYLALDRDNREYTNFWRLSVATGALEKLTHSQSDQGPTFSHDLTKLWARDVRRLADGTFQTTLYELDLLSLERRDLLSDQDWDYRVGWTTPVMADDEEALYFAVDHLSQRRRTNIARWDFRTRTLRLLLPSWMEEMGRPALYARRILGGRLFFESFHEGFENLYRLNIATGVIERETRFEEKVKSLSLKIHDDGSYTRIATFEENRGFWAEVRDRHGLVRRFRLPGEAWVFTTTEEPWFYVSAADLAPCLMQVDGASGETRRRISTLAVPGAAVEHTRSEWVEYESFDGLKIPALLMRPKGPLRGAVVVSFYGGEDQFTALYQLFAELGLAVLSPAVRGSWGWGREWEGRLVGDLGGREIRDAIEGGRFVEKALGLTARQVGIYGSSHGGYATLRALTLPDVEGKDPRYPFGFAIAEAGFADLIAFHRDSRIADWLVHLLGPYREDLYRDRSPVTHFERLRTPVLVINGTNDTRVPYSTIEGFIEKLKASDRPHRLHIHVGQGHHAMTRETLREDRRVMVDFLREWVLENKM